MADKNIGALTQVSELHDDSMLVVEQQGEAMKVSGAQFKEFGRQAVIGEMQGYVDQAQEAATAATGAVSAVTDMTVEAHASETATVEKTTKNGVFNLSFGLPRGEQGIQGPEGKQGPPGQRGETGTGLTILGHYDTLDPLKAPQTAPKVGDAYGVGTAAPYDINVCDGVANDWVNYGPLSGGGGVIPENVVTCEGGAVIEVEGGFADGPHVIRITNEEEPPLTAEDVAYSDTQNVKEAMDGLFTSVGDGKALIASAITDKGVPTAQDAEFSTMAANIGQISTGSDTSDATATPGDILAPKTAYTATGKVEGIIPTLAAQTITPGTADKTIANGQYLGGTQTIKGDANLTSSNIKKGVSIFGVNGAMESTFKATLTVTADTGAVVTATHTDGTKVEALSTNGTVVLDLPIEGAWTVTAQRGVAQYNTVTLNVTSQYSAELTAEVHIEYFGEITALSAEKYGLVAASAGGHALFGCGQKYTTTWFSSPEVDSYDADLVHNVPENASRSGPGRAAAAAGEYVLFSGGNSDANSTAYADVDVYDSGLTRFNAAELQSARYNLASVSFNGYALFGGGNTRSNDVAHVDAYDSSLTHTTPTDLAVAGQSYSAGANSNYAIFAGSGSSTVSAYDKDLVRSIPTGLSSSVSNPAAVRAGNYVLIAGGLYTNTTSKSTVYAYDLFLTRTLPAELTDARGGAATATIGDHALIVGGKVGKQLFGNTTDQAYDPYLTVISVKGSSSMADLAGTPIGDYALFGGGRSGEMYYQVTDYVKAYRYV